MNNVLIGSCGGLTGVYLLKQFKQFKDCRIFGFDSNINSAAHFFCERVFELPNATSSNFIDKLLSLLINNRIDVYIPTHSKEIRVISENEEYIRHQVNTKFIVSPFKSFLDLDNKSNAYKNLGKVNIPCPRIILSAEDIVNYPVFAKKKIGSGSSGTLVVDTKEQYDILKKNKEYLIVEYINGDEYTVDCMFSEDGNLLGYNQRKRVKCIGGAVSISKNINPLDIEPYILKLAKNWTFKGCVNFQYILKDNNPIFIDINLRFASGGLPLSVKSGVNVPLAYKKILTGLPIENDEFKSDFKNRTMYRYFEEVYDE